MFAPFAPFAPFANFAPRRAAAPASQLSNRNFLSLVGGGFAAVAVLRLADLNARKRPFNVRAERLATAGRLGGELQHIRWAARRPGGLPWTVRSRARG